ncbi:MAG: hypothetical protein ABH863_06500 [Candidatus Micrarchaeota archaeon]
MSIRKGKIRNWEIQEVGKSAISGAPLLHSRFKGTAPLELNIYHEPDGGLDRIEVHHSIFGDFLLTENGLEQNLGTEFRDGRTSQITGKVPRVESNQVRRDLLKLMLRSDHREINAHPCPWLSAEVIERIRRLTRPFAKVKRENG